MKTPNIDHKVISINARTIGKGFPVFTIAEAGFNHNGKLEIAKKLVDAAKKAGSDCIKFQKRAISELAIKSVLDSPNPRFANFGKTYAEARRNLELSKKDYKELIKYCASNQIIFLCTAFDKPSSDLLEDLGVKALKIASHSMTNIPLLLHVAKKKMPIILSTGMSTFEEVNDAVNVFRENGTQLLINHCVSIYPQKPSQSNLKLIEFYDNYFEYPIGYSGHESGLLISLAAVALGAVAVERHFTLDRNMKGPDHKISLEPQEFKELVDRIATVSDALGTPQKSLLLEEIETAKKYHYSIVAAINIRMGSKITEKMLTSKNPGTGLPPKYIEEIIGRVANVNIPKDTLLDLGMLG